MKNHRFKHIFLILVCCAPLFVHSKLVVVTACNDAFFDKCLTLISSVHSTSFSVVDEIFVYDLGLSPEHAAHLKKIQKVSVRTFEEIRDKFPGMDIDFLYQKPGSFGWKQVCVHDAASQEGDLVFWLDAGAVFLQSAQEIFDLIEQDDIFLVVDEWHNYTWTHPKCIEIMEATENELRDFQLCAGIHGYKKGGRYQAMMNEALRFSFIKECVDGHQFYNYGINLAGEEIRGHRHDQSILSILASRYKCPKQEINRYGEWRAFAHCRLHDSVIWVHRGHYRNHEGILYRCY